MTAGLHHRAFFYRDETEYLDGTLAFITEGLDAGEAVAVAVPAARLALLRGALGPRAAKVLLTDMSRAGRNPGRIIPGVFHAFVDAQPAAVAHLPAARPAARTPAEAQPAALHAPAAYLPAARTAPHGARRPAPAAAALSLATPDPAPDQVPEQAPAPAAPRVRIVGEPVWPGRTALEYPACVQHEALVNAAFDGRPLSLLCPYDAAGLAPGALADARATHPLVVEDGRERASDLYAPERTAESFNVPLAEPASCLSYDFDDDRLRGAREFVVRAGGAAGLAGTRLDDLVLAVAELTTNSVLHGGGSGVVRLWAEAGQVACEVRDRGTMDDPLAGRRVPLPGRPGGRGLLMTHQLADLVRTHAVPGSTTIRLYLSIQG